MFAKVFIAATALASLTSPVVSLTEFKCPEDWSKRKINVYADPTDIYSYFVCGHNGATRILCNGITRFDDKLHYCTDTFLTCPEQFALLNYPAHSNPFNKNTYFSCGISGATLVNCPASKTFDSTQHKCV